MSFRTRVSVLSVILLALLIAYTLGTVFSPQARRARAANQPVISAFDTGDVAEIELVSQEEADEATRVVLRRSNAGDGWAVQLGERFVPARDSRVSSFFDAVSALRTTRTVTENPELYSDFEIGEGAANRLVLFGRDGQPITTAYFGKAASQGNRVYVRTGDDPTVYLTQNSVSFYFQEAGEYWAELTPLPRSLSGSGVQRISISADIAIGDGGEGAGPEERQRRVANFTVFRDENGAWQFDESFSLPEGATIDQQTIDRWASNIVDFEAASHATEVSENAEAGLDSPALEVSISTEQGREYVLSVGDAAGAQAYYLRASGPNVLSDEDGEPFILTGSLFGVRRLFRAADDLYSLREEEESGQSGS